MIYLMPGLDGSGVLFEPLRRLLPETTRVVSYPVETADWDGFVTSAAEQIDTAQPYVVFAESVSGLIALRLLRQRPDNCQGLVACGTFLTNPAPWRTAVAALPGLYRLLGDPPEWAIRYLLLSRDSDPELVRTVGEVLRTVPPRTVIDRVQLIRGLTLERYAFPFPVTYVRGDRDRIVGRKHETEWLANVEGCQLADPASGAHLLAQENPEAIAPLLTGWM